MNPSAIATPVQLSVADWDKIIMALGFLPQMVAGPIVASVTGQVRAASAPRPDPEVQPE